MIRKIFVFLLFMMALNANAQKIHGVIVDAENGDDLAALAANVHRGGLEDLAVRRFGEVAQVIHRVGKPAALMNKEDKMRAIGFLSQSGAFLVTKSGDKVAKYFGISKYTLYSYIDANKQEEKKHG